MHIGLQTFCIKRTKKALKGNQFSKKNTYQVPKPHSIPSTLKIVKCSCIKPA